MIKGKFALYVWPICETHRDQHFFENKIFKNWKKNPAEIDDFFFLSKEEEKQRAHYWPYSNTKVSIGIELYYFKLQTLHSNICLQSRIKWHIKNNSDIGEQL